MSKKSKMPKTAKRWPNPSDSQAQALCETSSEVLLSAKKKKQIEEALKKLKSLKDGIGNPSKPSERRLSRLISR